MIIGRVSFRNFWKGGQKWGSPAPPKRNPDWVDGSILIQWNLSNQDSLKSGQPL